MKCCTCGADFKAKAEPNIYYCEKCGAVWVISPGEEGDGNAMIQHLSELGEKDEEQ